MTYRDMTFCSGDGCQNFNKCFRALTPEVKKSAEKWWGGPGAPISQFANPWAQECYVPPSDKPQSNDA